MKEKCKYENESSKYILIDLIFSFSPLLILIFIRLITKSWENIFKRSDLSFLSMILIGQTIIKLILGVMKNKNEKKLGNILLVFIFLLLFGFLPPAFYLILIEINRGNIIIYILQTIWIILATIFYYIIGTDSNILSENYIRKDDFIEETRLSHKTIKDR